MIDVDIKGVLYGIGAALPHYPVSSTGLKPLSVLAWSIGLTAMLAAMLGAATLWLSSSLQMEEKWVRHTLAVENQIAEVLILLQRLENNQRGYLLTGRNVYLGRYEDMESALPAVIDETARLVTDNPQQEQRIALLRQVVTEKLRELRSTIDEQNAGRADAARAIVNSDRGLQMMDQIRQLLSEMRSEEDRLLDIRGSALDMVGTLLQIGAATAVLLICAVGVLVSLYTRHSFAELTVARDHLAAANRNLIEEMQQREKSKARLQLALDAARLGSWQYDPRHRVMLGDARFKEIFELAEHEAPIEEVMKRVHPDDAERVRKAFEEMRDPVGSKGSATEFRLRRRDEGVRWVETLGVAEFEGGGRERPPASIVGTVAEISERKEREEKEHLLMREINHRAKNMLSVVDAIARQTATKSSEDFVERFSERIQALSANHDLLVRNEWKGVDVEDLVRAQLAHFADLVESRIIVGGPNLRLNAAAAQAIGLAIHELATNAGKYGALSVDAGRVDVGWRVDGGLFAITWTERDGPPVSLPQRRGFGSIVVERVAARALDGVVDLDYAPSGVTWRLTCQAVNAVGT